MLRGAPWTALPSLLAALAIGAAGAAQSATVWVSIPPGADPCSFDQLAAALRSRLTDVRVEAGTNDLDPGDVGVLLHRDVDGWSLVVKVVDAHELRRTLPPIGEDCVALAETAAFMVERYLGEVRWTGARVVVAPVAPPRPIESHWQAVAELGIAGALTPSSNANSSVELNPELEVDLEARKGPWDLGVEAAGEIPQLAAGPSGSASLGTIQYTPATFQLLESYRLKLGPGALRLEVLPGVEAVWASLLGASAVKPAFAITGRVAWEVPIYRRLFASFRLSGRVILPEIVIVVGLPAQPYLSGYGAFDASAAVGYLLF